MNKIKNLILVIPCMLFIDAAAQDDLQDSSFYEASVHQAISYYYKSIAENAHLYNGSEYVQYIVYNPEQDRNPFFQSIFMQNGSVLFDGTNYQDVPITYDIYKDVLVTLRYNWNYRIRLNPDKVGSFILAGHRFVLIKDDSTTGLADGSGFYESVYSGKNLEVFAKRKKKKEERYYAAEFTTYFFPNDHYYIRKDGNYYQVNSKKSVLAVLHDKKKEIRKYLRKNNISFKPRPEEGIAKSAAYYDQLKN